ncbi:DUF255 domain-containing protein [Bacillus cabrialesii]|nr:DUF255 domain-containing protein [Bacillus cabrialesii]
MKKRKAKRENKPVLVSISYSTCHWWQVRIANTYNYNILEVYYIQETIKGDELLELKNKIKRAAI